jgi:hypothetical protein
MKFLKMEGNLSEILTDVLTNFDHYPYRYLVNKKNDVIAFWKQDIQKRIKEGGELYLGVSKTNEVKCFALLEELPWDSKIFGKKMGALTYLTFSKDSNMCESKKFVNWLLSQAKEKGFEFILSKVNTDNISATHSLESNDFLLVDTLLDFIWNKISHPLMIGEVCNGKIKIEEATLDDECELREIARKAFIKHFGRYHSDPKIPKMKANSIYEEWVSSSLRGYADYFYVARVEGKIAGYSIWKNPSDLERSNNLSLGHYSIAGVSENYRGMGIFKVLTYAGMKVLGREVDIIEGPTHINNYPVQKGYISLGWRIGDARHSFHKWL